MATAASPRTRVVDEHMFTVARALGPTTFRLQLFTATGLRPVAVVTQPEREGLSLVNGAERYAAAGWMRYLPDDPEPPIWVQRQFVNSTADAFTQVLFTVTGPHTPANPRWRRLTDQTLAALVGAPVDADRGAGGYARSARAAAGGTAAGATRATGPG